jgi:hypothetical protein
MARKLVIWASVPETNIDQVGEQEAAVWKPVNRRPSSAILCKFGVLIFRPHGEVSSVSQIICHNNEEVWAFPCGAHSCASTTKGKNEEEVKENLENSGHTLLSLYINLTFCVIVIKVSLPHCCRNPAGLVAKKCKFNLFCHAPRPVRF